MDRMDATAVDIFVLNYNGRGLLAECLPSIVRAANASRRACRVTVVDNASTDDSLELLAQEFPTVAVRRLANEGLASFNAVMQTSTARAALLLNNDVIADEGAIDPLVDALLDPVPLDGEPVFMTAPRCFLFDGRTHEGLQTAVRLRRGLVQATAIFPGAEQVAAQPGPTASAGAALAVDREKFLAIGGFDPAYLPGRIEDLDFAYRGFQRGFQARYVPMSVFLHRGAATFGPTFGYEGNRHLALRNTLLFQWKHLRSLRHVAMQCIWLPVRAALDVWKAPWVERSERFGFLKACGEALRLIRLHGACPPRARNIEREREFFRRHSPQSLTTPDDDSRRRCEAWRCAEASRDRRHPVSRHYLCDTSRRAAELLATCGVRPWHVTALGVLAAFSAAACLTIGPSCYVAAALLVMASWFCDRTDGPLARLTGQATKRGAWIDANVDELVDLSLHGAAAFAACRDFGAAWPAFCFGAFLFGKYLLLHGLATDELGSTSSRSGDENPSSSRIGLLRNLYHLLGNADVRVHLLAAAAATGLLGAELAFTAIYFNVRWTARLIRLAWKPQSATPAEAAV